MFFLWGNYRSIGPESRKFLDITMQCIGKDLSPREGLFGCAETVNTLAVKTWGEPVGGDLSTAKMLKALVESPRFVQVVYPFPGDIIISPTGHGNGKISNGHVGVVVENSFIASNNSINSLLEINYTIKAWRERYGVVGGFPVLFFRRI